MFALAGERKAASINWIQFYRTRTDAEDKSYNHREHLIPLKVKSEAVGRSARPRGPVVEKYTLKCPPANQIAC